MHEPLQVPAEYYEAFDFMEKNPAGAHVYQNISTRQTYAAMVKYMDDVVGNLTAALKAKGMWDDTLVFVQSDNGGLAFDGPKHNANNWPLKGSKFTNFEGGVRVNGFVGGGFVAAAAPAMVGRTLNGLVHTCDFYATFCALAGIPAHDSRAALAGLPPVDSLDMWPYLSGNVTASPRTTIYGDTDMVIDGGFKYIAAETDGACWAGPTFPNASTVECTATDCAQGCVYDIYADAAERVNLIGEPAHADRVAALKSLLATCNEGLFDPDRGKADPEACDQAIANGNFWGPWVQ